MPVKLCSWGTCNSDNRYPERCVGVTFIPFVKPSVSLDRCFRWIQACGRPHSKLNVRKIAKWTYICSKHFVDGRPTPTHPDPLPAPVQADLELSNTADSDETPKSWLVSLGNKRRSQDHGDYLHGDKKLRLSDEDADLTKQPPSVASLSLPLSGCSPEISSLDQQESLKDQDIGLKILALAAENQAMKEKMNAAEEQLKELKLLNAQVLEEKKVPLQR